MATNNLKDCNHCFMIQYHNKAEKAKGYATMSLSKVLKWLGDM